MLVLGLPIGAAFPLASLLFATPRNTTTFVLFTLLSALAGLAVSFLYWYLASRTSTELLRRSLDTARDSFGFQVTEAGTMDQMNAELDRVLREAAGAAAQLRMMNGRMKQLTSDILSATEQQASGSAEKASAVSQTSATLEELAQTSKQIAENSESVVRVAERTLASAEEGMSAVSDTAAGIEEIRSTTQQSSDRILALGERSQEIGRVLTIIDEIAEQTKILALNAAIEAARAGEAGKGFSVVAEEIRKLADSVTESTQEIGRVVRDIQASTSALVMATERAAKKVEEGKQLALSTANALDRIVTQVEQTTDAAKQISIATQQQRTASDQVVVSMKEVAYVSRQSAESSRQISQAIMELDSLADSNAGA
jgi:methyl-accepting chemotaxis protein